METFTSSERISRSSSDAEARSNNDDNGAVMTCGSPFMCEICGSGTDNSAVFKERRHLDAHILKSHSTACIGCYDVFESRKRLFEHLEVEKHEKPSHCHQCQGVFLDNAGMEGHDCEAKCPVIEESQVKEECVSSDDDEETTISSGNAFLCEICDSGDNESHAVFKERSDLVLHTFKNHPCSCIGCFESFDTPDDLKKHVMGDSHGLLFCRECWRLFPDNDRLVCHPCKPTSNEENHKDDRIDSEESEYEEVSVKMEPQSEDEGSEFLYSSENYSNDEIETDQQPEEGGLACIHCIAEGFQNQHELRVHTCKEHLTVCIVCFEGFDDETSLQKHQKALHHTVWKCTKCNLYFIRRAFYRIHVSLKHPENCPHKCPDCDKRCFSRDHIVDHQRRAHGKETLKMQLRWGIFSNMCHICLKSFMTGYSLLLHMFREHNEPGQTHVYKCELCQLGFGRGTAFEVHLKRDHADDTDYLSEVKALMESTLKKSLICDACDYICPTNRSGCLQRHILAKHPEMRPHKCHICGARYPEESDVRVHIGCEHEGPPGIVCPMCDFSSRTGNVLTKHLTKCHGYQGMPYMYCFAHKKGFSTHREYCTHFEVHHMDPADRPIRPKPKTGYPCQYCGKEFGQRCFLKNHIAKVHECPKERLKCDECGKTFKTFESLTNHKVVHTDAFKCEICGKSFGLQFYLDRHQVVHSGEKPFLCKFCGLRVSQNSSLRRHIKVVHAEGKPMKKLKPRRTRGPKHEARRKRVEINEVKNLCAEDQPVMASDNVKKNTNTRKRRKDSKSPSGTSPEVTIVPKRRRGRPRKETSEAGDHYLNDFVSTRSTSVMDDTELLSDDSDKEDE